MIKDFYINTNGEKVIISAMANTHLFNALAKYKAKLSELDNLILVNSEKSAIDRLFDLRQTLKETVTNLKAEFEKRDMV